MLVSIGLNLIDDSTRSTQCTSQPIGSLLQVQCIRGLCLYLERCAAMTPTASQRQLNSQILLICDHCPLETNSIFHD